MLGKAMGQEITGRVKMKKKGGEMVLQYRVIFQSSGTRGSKGKRNIW